MRYKESQRGFTLIEIVIALAISGILGTAVTSAIFQVFAVNARSAAHMTAVKEVENAVHWITPDAQMAQSVNMTTPNGFPLILTWLDWNGNSNSATYSVVNGRLERSYSVNGGQPNTTVVVAHANSAQTSCLITSTELSFQITSTVSAGAGQESETRSFDVIPRTAPITINATGALVIATTSVPNGEVGVGYSQTLTALGGTSPYIWAISGGALPPGLSLSAGGVISGTPSAAGTFPFTVQVTDSASPTPAKATKSLLLTVNGALAITTTSLPAGQVNTAYNQTLAASGGTTPYTWEIIGPLPAGLALDSGKGIISGTPSAAGTSSFTAQVTDSASPTQAQATKNLSITIAGALTITTTSLPNGYVYVAYSQTLAATGGVTPYTWTISGGSLPAGLTLSSGGVVSGTPTAAGTSSFTVQVTDSASPANTATQGLSITVAATTPPSVTTNSATNPHHSSATLNGTLTALGSSGSVTLSFDWGTDISYSGGNVPANPSSWSGYVPESFSCHLSSLASGTTYHFRAKAVGADGSTAYGADQQFTTGGHP